MITYILIISIRIADVLSYFDREIHQQALWDHKSEGQTFLIYDIEPRLSLVHYWSFVYVHPDAGQVRDILAATNGRKIEDRARKEGER